MSDQVISTNLLQLPGALPTSAQDVLRHTNAMTMLQAGIDTTTIALWLGHEHEQTKRGYLHGDLALKQRALA